MGKRRASQPAAPAASHWLDPISAARRRFSKPYWPAPAPSPARARSPTRITVGDASPEARASRHERRAERRRPSISSATASPSSIAPARSNFSTTARVALTACDAAVVVCEPDDKKVPALQLILKQLEDRGIPHFLFLNKIDKADARVRDIAADAAAGERQAAGAAPDPDLGERHRHRLRRSRARARLRLSRACAERGRSSIPDERRGARDRRRASPCWSSSPTTTTS